MLFDVAYQKIQEAKAAAEAEIASKIAGQKAVDEASKKKASPGASLSKTLLIVGGIGLGLYFLLKK